MNKSYINMGNYTLVESDNGVRKIETTDNIKNILLQENRIETIKTRIEELSNNLEKEYISDPKKHFKRGLKEIILTILISTLIGTTTLIVTPQTFIIFLIFEVVLFSPIIGVEYSNYKNNINNKIQYESELEFLNNQIGKEKIKLNSLSKHKTDDSKLNIKQIDINDQYNYLNSLTSVVNESVKTKKKSRFKK